MSAVIIPTQEELLTQLLKQKVNISESSSTANTDRGCFFGNFRGRVPELLEAAFAPKPFSSSATFLYMRIAHEMNERPENFVQLKKFWTELFKNFNPDTLQFETDEPISPGKHRTIAPTTAIENTTSLTLPTDVWLHILFYLGPVELSAVACVSHSLHKLATAEKLWRPLFNEVWSSVFPTVPFASQYSTKDNFRRCTVEMQKIVRQLKAMIAEKEKKASLSQTPRFTNSARSN